MSNMSYCRFENTAGDLADCVDALEELLRGEGEPLSDDELMAAKRLVKRCMDVAMLIEETTGEAYEDLDAAKRDVDNALDCAQQDAEKQKAVRAAYFDPHPANDRCRNCGGVRTEHSVGGLCDADEQVRA